MPYIVTEKIDHGSYHNERSAEIETRDDFQKFLEGSPYKPGNPAYVAVNLWPHLVHRGGYSHGWAWFTLTEKEGWV